MGEEKIIQLYRDLFEDNAWKQLTNEKISNQTLLDVATYLPHPDVYEQILMNPNIEANTINLIYDKALEWMITSDEKIGKHPPIDEDRLDFLLIDIACNDNTPSLIRSALTDDINAHISFVAANHDKATKEMIEDVLVRFNKEKYETGEKDWYEEHIKILEYRLQTGIYRESTQVN